MPHIYQDCKTFSDDRTSNFRKVECIGNRALKGWLEFMMATQHQQTASGFDTPMPGDSALSMEKVSKTTIKQH